MGTEYNTMIFHMPKIPLKNRVDSIGGNASWTDSDSYAGDTGKVESNLFESITEHGFEQMVDDNHDPSMTWDTHDKTKETPYDDDGGNSCNDVHPATPSKLDYNSSMISKNDDECSRHDFENPIDAVEPGTSAVVKGKLKLLRAILEGRSASKIKKMLDSGADANVVSTVEKFNVVHCAIHAQLKGNSGKETTRDILKLLMNSKYNFNSINGDSKDGTTPLLYALKLDGLEGELLDLFQELGADFNVADRQGNSVLLNAIAERHDIGVIRKILEHNGDNWRHPNYLGHNALIAAAKSGNAPALQFFVDKFNVNARDKWGYTALSWLFVYEDKHLRKDYENCLQLLIQNNADINMTGTGKVNTPLLDWIEYSREDPYPVLVKLKGQLPISPEIASAAFTLTVKNLGASRHLPFAFDLDETVETLNPFFIQFLQFLVEEKAGKLFLQDGIKGYWSDLGNTGKRKLKNIEVDPSFLEEVGHRMGWRKTPYCDTLSDLVARYPEISFEAVILALLKCKHFEEFLAVCSILSKVCRKSTV